MSSNRFYRALARHQIAPLRRTEFAELQINLGYRCNQACSHCHVDAGPKRTEMMTRQTMDRIVDWIDKQAVERVDLTGGCLLYTSDAADE